MEILLLDYGHSRFGPLPGSDHPAVVRLIREGYEPFSESRTVAYRQARAPIVGFLEDHATALPGWAQGIIAAHQQGWKAIGPEVHSDNPGVGISDAVGLMNNIMWRPPAREGTYELLAGHNTAYDKEALASLPFPIEVLLRCDPVLQWLLQEQGHLLYLNPAIKISHLNETEAADIFFGYFSWNRVFAATRAEVFGWSWWYRGLRLLLTPLIPPVRLIKHYRLVRAEHSDLLGLYFRSLHIQLLAHSIAALGQALGFAFGMGGANKSFLEYELKQERRQ
jgi:hypothetical protein